MKRNNCNKILKVGKLMNLVDLKMMNFKLEWGKLRSNLIYNIKFLNF